MTVSNDQGRAGGAALTAAIGLMTIVLFQAGGALAKGLAEARRLNLSVDLEALNEAAAGDQRAEAAAAPRDRHSSQTKGSVPEAAPRWEQDPSYLTGREPGGWRKPEYEFQESEFGNQIRRYLGR